MTLVALADDLHLKMGRGHSLLILLDLWWPLIQLIIPFLSISLNMELVSLFSKQKHSLELQNQPEICTEPQGICLVGIKFCSLTHALQLRLLSEIVWSFAVGNPDKTGNVG